MNTVSIEEAVEDAYTIDSHIDTLNPKKDWPNLIDVAGAVRNYDREDLEFIKVFNKTMAKGNFHKEEAPWWYCGNEIYNFPFREMPELDIQFVVSNSTVDKFDLPASAIGWFYDTPVFFAFNERGDIKTRPILRYEILLLSSSEKSEYERLLELLGNGSKEWVELYYRAWCLREYGSDPIPS